jgi:hypothetical protein
MMKRIKYILLGVIAGIVICLLNGWVSCHRTADKEVITITDTLVLTDTIVKMQPKPYKVTIIDTIYLPQRPQQPQIDTLIRQEVTYKDSTYTAVVGGIEPYLKSIEIYPKTIYVNNNTTTTIKVRSRFGLGVQAGYGYGRNGLQPYVGIGVQYNLIQW